MLDMSGERLPGSELGLHQSLALAPARIQRFSKSGKNPAPGKIPPEPAAIAEC